MTSQYLTVIATISYHPIHPKSQNDQGKQLIKQGVLQEPHRRTPQTLPHTDEMAEGDVTEHYMQPDADNSVEQIDPTPANPCSSKFDLRHNPRPNCNDDYRY